MHRLLIHVEGETEETFVNQVLACHLVKHGYVSVSARLLGNARQRDRRGGIRGWNSVRKDIITHLKEDQYCIATTMVDYYALPQSGEKAWPGRETSGTLPFKQKASTVENALHLDVCTEFNTTRFLPFVMMHEFEGLLFSDCARFASAIGKNAIAGQLQNIRDKFSTPEEINDSPETAPSKRIQQLIPGYQKTTMGTLAVLEIGLDTIRKECPHFNSWLGQLESFGKQP